LDQVLELHDEPETRVAVQMNRRLFNGNAKPAVRQGRVGWSR
jgi:hypothetical protein